jgi:hypothetical protein
MANDFPLYLYIYTKDVRYGNPEVIRDREVLGMVMSGRVKDMIGKGREVRIVDGDDYLVFHSKGGRIIFPQE